jgi:drug/metabolite transporter (DMT)-like permease
LEIFKNERLRPLLAAFCAFGWSLAYPFIKIGYRVLGIGEDLGSKLVFAGIRFTMAGILVLCFARSLHADIRIREKNVWPHVLLFAVVNTWLHYLTAYIGLTYIPSSRSTILDSMGGFFLIILSGFLYREDKIDARKVIGCIVGILGIFMINVGPIGEMLSGISFLGDGLILLNACCAAWGGIITRNISKKVDVTLATGYSMLIGGLMLLLCGAVAGIQVSWNITLSGIGVICVLFLISAVCFGIYNLLLANHPISKVAIFNALIPVLGVMFASLLLGEPFKWQYLAACLCVATGIYMINTDRKTKQK